jgi:negative regulator of sigma E activity
MLALMPALTPSERLRSTISPTSSFVPASAAVEFAQDWLSYQERRKRLIRDINFCAAAVASAVLVVLVWTRLYSANKKRGNRRDSGAPIACQTRNFLGQVSLWDPVESTAPCENHRNLKSRIATQLHSRSGLDL